MLRLTITTIASALIACSMPAEARLQCAPYARSVSGIDIQGNAESWWGKAASDYQRGNRPKVNAVLVFQATQAMPYGHVAVVKNVIDDRHIVLNHANWSRPGMIENNALAVDISDKGDWSKVRVWYEPTGSLGTRENPAFGFIYGSEQVTAPKMAKADQHDQNG